MQSEQEEKHDRKPTNLNRIAFAWRMYRSRRDIRHPIHKLGKRLTQKQSAFIGSSGH